MFYQASLVITQDRPDMEELLRVLHIQDFPYRKDHEDIFLVEAEGQSIKTVQIDTLIKWAGLRPFSAPLKIGIIFEAQFLTTEAQNKLLKTLEEPPEDTVLCLITPSATGLLPTIRSRCRLILLSEPEVTIPSESAAASTKLAQQFIEGDLEKRLTLIKENLGDSIERGKAILFVADICRALLASPDKQKLTSAQFYLSALEKGANIKPTLETMALVL